MTKTFWLIFVSVLILNASGFSQLSLVSSSPAHGDINVDTTATFTLTFSEPLDTSVRFENPGDFFLNLYLHPDSLYGDPDSITLSTDLKTVYVYNLHLAADVIYLFTIVDAVSMNGDSLDQPYSMTFTTASGLPTADVSGTLSYPNNDPAGTWVVLLDDYPFRQKGGGLVNGIVIPPSINFYTIDYVYSSWYWVAALKNFHIDDEGNPLIEAGTGVGFHDADNDYVIDSIEVTTDSHISGIDFTLHTAVLQTARDPLALVEGAVQTWSGDAFLAGLAAEVNPDGNSTTWQYLFYSPALNEHTAWVNVGDLVLRGLPEDTEGDTIAVPPNWMDSDLIMGIAESNGGSEFRQSHPDAEFYAALTQFEFDNDKFIRILFSTDKKSNNTILNYPGFIRCISNNKRSQPNSINSLSMNNSLLPIVWAVQYYSPSTEEYLIFIIDPVTGEILSAPTSAAVAEQAAYPVAQDWASDVKLWAVWDHLQIGLDTLGNSQMWGCIYYSPILDSLHIVISWGQISIDAGSPGFTPMDTLTVPAGWRDSDECLSAAEANGGSDYRYSNPNTIINASLMRWFQGFNPDLTVWTFTYSSTTAPDLQILVNAFTGLIVGVEPDEMTYVPEKFNLSQNYPNPFNPITKIIFEVPEKELVTLTVYDLLGSVAAVLVNEEKEPGRYEVEFNAKNLSSGVYIYRLKSSKYNLTRKFVLIK
jgi:hypothetical protein